MTKKQLFVLIFFIGTGNAMEQTQKAKRPTRQARSSSTEKIIENEQNFHKSMTETGIVAQIKQYTQNKQNNQSYVPSTKRSKSIIQ